MIKFINTKDPFLFIKMTSNFYFILVAALIWSVNFFMMNWIAILCLIICFSEVKSLKLNRHKPSTIWGIQKKSFLQGLGEYFRSKDGAYQFQYDTGNSKHQIFRNEERFSNGTVVGFFGYIDPGGILRITEYTAGRNGYKQRTVLRHPIFI